MMPPLPTEAEVQDAVRAAHRRVRSLWLGDDGRLRRGHGGDLVTMLEDLGVPTVSVAIFERPKPLLFVSPPCAGHSRHGGQR